MWGGFAAATIGEDDLVVVSSSLVPSQWGR